MDDSTPVADDPRYLGTREAAELLDVGESTIKRWANRGVLPVALTAGKHRKIRLADLVRVAREKNLPRARLERLLLRPFDPTDHGPLPERLHDALAAADGPRATSLLALAHASGYSIARIADELIAPAMTRIGHGWETGALDVYQEHRGTQVCLAALQALRPRLPAPDAAAPLALGGGPEGDHYVLANVLIELALLEEGWRVENVGPNTPLASLARAARERRPRLVWLSCSYLADVDGFVAGYAGLYREAKAAGASVAVGGRALGADVRRRLTFTHHGDTLGHLAAYARELRRERRPA